MTTWCATGHRPDKLGGYSIGGHKLTEFAVWYLSQHRPDQFISGMAQGWDLACAEACIALRIPWTAAVPCVGQEKMWPPAAQERYRKVLFFAKRVHTISTTYSPRAMQLRNEWMVDNSDGIVALWDGSSGGTANCVRYAEAQGKPLVNLWPWWRV